MKRLLTFLVLVSMAAAAHADPTTDLLTAPYVKDFITLSTGPENGKQIVKYTIDTVSGSPKSADKLVFRSDGQINIYIHNLNPLTQAWVVEAKATPDVSYAAIKAFLDDLTALQDALLKASGTSVATEETPQGAPEAPAKKDDCAHLNDLINQAYALLTVQELSASVLQDLVAGANGHAGVTAASKEFVVKQKEIKINIEEARRTLAQIRTEYSALDNQPTKACGAVTGQILVDYIQVQSTADQIIAAKEALREQLGDLVKFLKPYLQQNAWHEPDLSDYLITSVTPTFTDQQTVTASVKEQSIQLDDDSMIVITSDEENVVAGTFTVRKSSFFVPERAVAVIYNNLTYPQYGTAMNKAGEMIVERAEDHQPIDGAMMLNLVMRFGRLNSSVVYPLLQLGVSSAKDFPGFLAGVGLRFVEPFRFSLSVGGMITRYKDLDGNLKIGDVVSGTDDINKHLTYKTSPVVIYGAMQLKF